MLLTVLYQATNIGILVELTLLCICSGPVRQQYASQCHQLICLPSDSVWTTEDCRTALYGQPIKGHTDTEMTEYIQDSKGATQDLYLVNLTLNTDLFYRSVENY